MPRFKTASTVYESSKEPIKPCWKCKGTEYWLNAYGEWTCQMCYPKPTRNKTLERATQEKYFER